AAGGAGAPRAPADRRRQGQGGAAAARRRARRGDAGRARRRAVRPRRQGQGPGGLPQGAGAGRRGQPAASPDHHETDRSRRYAAARREQRLMDKRRFLQVFAAAALAVVMLSGCSSIKNLFGGRNKDKSGEPAKLVDFTPTV